MNESIIREAPRQLLSEFTQSESLRKHALAVEACMRACSRKLSDGSPDVTEDEENLWRIVGLIHDFDYDRWPSLEDHPYKGNAILSERGWNEVITRAIKTSLRRARGH